jgi:hypothetical protein
MSLSNSERQRKYRENKLSATGNHYRLQLIIDHKTHAELSNIILRNTRLNSENRLLNSPDFFGIQSFFNRLSPCLTIEPAFSTFKTYVKGGLFFLYAGARCENLYRPNRQGGI